jgi:hypothetical protein
MGFEDSQFPPFNSNFNGKYSLCLSFRLLAQREKAATVDLLVGFLSPVVLQLFFLPLESPCLTYT